MLLINFNVFASRIPPLSCAPPPPYDKLPASLGDIRRSSARLLLPNVPGGGADRTRGDPEGDAERSPERRICHETAIPRLLRQRKQNHTRPALFLISENIFGDDQTEFEG